MVDKKWFKSSNLWIGVVVFAVVVFLAWPSTPGEYDTFATCLTDSGAVMYGTDWCSHCQAQKAMFGNSFEKIDFVNCDFDKDACLISGVTGYPTWVIDGQNYPGQKPLTELSRLSGCELAKDLE